MDQVKTLGYSLTDFRPIAINGQTPFPSSACGLGHPVLSQGWVCEDCVKGQTVNLTAGKNAVYAIALMIIIYYQLTHYWLSY